MTMSPLEVRAVMTVALVVVLALAAREDLLRHRVPNVLTGNALLAGIGLAYVAGGWGGFLDSLGGVLVGATVLLPFYLMRGMGAGDVKLMAAAGAYLDPGSALLGAAIALVTGCVLAIAIVVARMIGPAASCASTGPGGPTALWSAAATFMTVRQERFPYAVAVAIGVLAVLGTQGRWAGVLAALGIA